MEVLVELLPAFMFLAMVLGLFSNLPVPIVLCGVTLIFGGIAILIGEIRFVQVTLMPSRVFGGIIENPVLVAAPMFIFMGILMEKTRVAVDLLVALQKVMRAVPGGLAIAVVFLGTILAAATGIIGASIIMLTVLAVPTMLDRGYSPALAAGSVASAGTLGILIPPSIMLVFMSDLLSINLARLFVAALIPGLVLAGCYLAYIIVFAAIKPTSAPKMRPLSDAEKASLPKELFVSLLLPLLIILAVLGSILGGIATPTEASGIGAFSAMLLGLFTGKLNFSVLGDALDGSIKTISMLFFIFVGATAFSYIFRHVGGEAFIIGTANSLNLGDWGLLVMMMVIVFLMGFFFDWIEITLILLPIFSPLIGLMNLGDHINPKDMIYWFAILMAVNLQSSFLTPPFGPALFFLQGAAAGRLKMRDIYIGVIPFVVIQLGALLLMIYIPAIVMWLPQYLFD